MILGFIQAATENASVCKDFLNEFLDSTRGRIRTQKVDYWKNSNQKQRWLATALLEIEPRLNRIGGYRHLPELRTPIQRDLGIISKQEMAA